MEQKPIIIAVCFIAIIALVIFLAYPKYQDLAVSRKQLDQKKQELERQEDYFSQINSVFEKLNNYQERLDKIDSALPEQASLPALYNYFQKVTSQNGLILSSLDVSQPSSSSDNADIQEINVSISAAGSYAALKNFISSLYKSARLIETESISFSGSEDGGLFNFNFKLKVHSYSPAPAVSNAEVGSLQEAE